MAARASAARRARSTAKTTRPVPAERKAARSAEAPARAPLHAPRTTGTESRGKYVYCIIRSDDPLKFGPVGIGTEPADVHTVNYKELAAVVSDTPVEVFDATRENVLAHERVNETVMRNHTVIPMSFGTVVKIREIEDEDEDVRRLKGEISSQKGSTYFARMQYGRLMDAALEARSERYVRDIFEELRPVSVASRANKPIGDKMIMNAAFLVAREKESAFDSKVKEIGARHGSLTFKYTGPWPPYNFVNIRLKLERAREG